MNVGSLVITGFMVMCITHDLLIHTKILQSLLDMGKKNYIFYVGVHGFI